MNNFLEIANYINGIESKYNIKFNTNKIERNKDLIIIFNWIISEFSLYINIFPSFTDDKMYFHYTLVNLSERKKLYTYENKDIDSYPEILYFSIKNTLKYILERND